MLREINLDEISDGRLYSSNDMAKTDCKDVMAALPVVMAWEIPSSLIHWMYTGFPPIFPNL